MVLSDLHVNLLIEGGDYQRKVGPVINGVVPTGPKKEYDWFNNHYTGIDYYLEYSGGLLVTDGFIRDLYVHMGFHPAWKHERVIELIFEKGVLQTEFDRSDQMADIRQRILKEPGDNHGSGMPSKDEIREFVERSFDRSYRM